MTVGRIFTQTSVINDCHFRNCFLDRRGCLLDNAAIVPGSGCIVIFFGGNAKQNHRRNAQFPNFLGLGDDLIDGQLINTGHRLYFIGDRLSGHCKEGIDQIIGRKGIFPHHAAKRLTLAKATGAARREHSWQK